MRILLKTFGVLERLIPEKDFLLDGEKLSLRQFLEILVQRYGPDLGKHLFPEGSYSSHYAILVNGVNIQQLQAMDTPLRNGDQVSIFTLVAGG